MNQLIEPFLGVWELDSETLKYEKGRPGRRAVYSVSETEDGLSFELDADDADGKPMHVVYRGKLDGVDRAIEGYPVTVSFAMLEDGSVESVARKNGVAVDRWTRKVTPDGNAMLICQHGCDTAEKPFINSGLYRRLK
jgi:hypothetical protein